MSPKNVIHKKTCAIRNKPAISHALYGHGTL